MSSDLLKRLSSILLLLLILVMANVAHGECPWPKRHWPASYSGEGCKWSLITETSCGKQMGDYGSKLFQHFYWDVGMLYKTSARTAVGMTFQLIADKEREQSGQIALKPRFRQWMGEMTYWEISPGLVLDASSEETDYKVKTPAFTATFAVGYTDIIAVVAQYESLHFTPQAYGGYHYTGDLKDYDRSDWWVGIRVGSLPGLVLIPVSLFVFAVSVAGETYPQ
jgi:hypothetical protein